MRFLLLTVYGLLLCAEGRSQTALPDSQGVRHLPFTFNGEPVDVLVASDERGANLRKRSA